MQSQPPDEDLLDTNPYYVYAPRYGNDVRNLRNAHPDGNTSDRVIAQALAVPEAEVPGWWEQIVAKMRALMNPENNEEQSQENEE